MKILFINNFFSMVGGTERVMWDEACLLKVAGHEVHFFATDKTPYLIPDYEHAHFFPKYKDLRSSSQFDKICHLSSAFHNNQAKVQLSKYLKQIKPDIIHIHNIHYHLTPAVLEACRKSGIPTVMTLHDNRLLCPSASYVDTPDFKGLCNTGNPLVCIQSKCKNNNLSETVVSIAEYYLNRNNLNYDAIQYFITPSQTLLSLMTKAKLPVSRLIHINNPVNSVFCNVMPVAESEGYFLYIGRLSPEKGVHYLLEAMAMQPTLALKIIGTGPQELELKSLAQELQLKNVIFLGYQSQEVILDCLKHCLATVLPCNWFETFGLSVAESLMLAKPVIASNMGAIPEVLDGGSCGILIPPCDVSALSMALGEMHSNPLKACEMGLRGKERAQALYTPEAHLRQLLTLYESISVGGIMLNKTMVSQIG